MTTLWRVWFWMTMTMHELRCSESPYNVYKDDGDCLVIHDACGRVWSA